MIRFNGKFNFAKLGIDYITTDGIKIKGPTINKKGFGFYLYELVHNHVL